MQKQRLEKKRLKEKVDEETSVQHVQQLQQLQEEQRRQEIVKRMEEEKERKEKMKQLNDEGNRLIKQAMKERQVPHYTPHNSV